MGASPLLAEEGSSEWKVARSVIIFILAGICEIGGGFLIWKGVRSNFGSSSSIGLMLCGSLVLALYGFVATLQDSDSFGRVYAIYGGLFIVLSYAWAAALDGFVPDRGDIIGCTIALSGVCIAWFWPRSVVD